MNYYVLFVQTQLCERLVSLLNKKKILWHLFLRWKCIEETVQNIGCDVSWLCACKNGNESV